MNKRLLPERIWLGQVGNYSVHHAFYKDCDFTGEGERVLRFIIPPFQRAAVWTRTQEIRFMESLIRGLPVGSYSYCSSFKYPKTDGWLIDGQQRMRTIANYLSSEFAVFGYKWSEITEVDRRCFNSVAFPAYVLNDLDEKELLERYIALNYSGTPHTDADEAKATRRLRELKEKTP